MEAAKINFSGYRAITMRARKKTCIILTALTCFFFTCINIYIFLKQVKPEMDDFKEEIYFRSTGKIQNEQFNIQEY